jgi:hypothetical protein
MTTTRTAQGWPTLVTSAVEPDAGCQMGSLFVFRKGLWQAGTARKGWWNKGLRT